MRPSVLQRKQAARVHGFTLSELLIALALLGLIATFTIPKVVQNILKTNYTAIYKEAYSSFSHLTSDATTEGLRFNSNSDFYSWLTSRLDIDRACPTNTLTEGCRTTTTASNWETGSGFKLKNASVVMMEMNLTDSRPWFTLRIDVNGDLGPNLGGDDIFMAGCNTTTAPLAFAGLTNAVKPGQCGIADASVSQWR